METIGPGSPVSTAAFRCSVGSPWQEEHFISSFECGVPAMLATGFSWHVRQSSTAYGAAWASSGVWAWAWARSAISKVKTIARTSTTAAFPAGGP